MRAARSGLGRRRGKGGKRGLHPPLQRSCASGIKDNDEFSISHLRFKRNDNIQMYDMLLCGEDWLKETVNGATSLKEA